jgi:hypothetical protein
LFDMAEITSSNALSLPSLLRYWRNSLAGRDNPKLSPSSGLRISRQTLESGFLPAEATRKVYQQERGAIAPDKPFNGDGTENQSALEVVVCPLVAKLKFEHGTPPVDRDDVIPLCIPAKLDPSGRLRPAAQRPWIPRELLEPMEGSDLVIGTLSDYDQFLTLHVFQPTPSWKDALTFASDLFQSVAGCDWRAYRPDGYAIEREGCILSNPVKNSPAIHVRKLLEHLSGPIPVEAYPLVQRFTQIRFTPLRPFLSPEEQAWHSPAHVAQMVSRFPLTPDQRSVLMHFLATSGDGQIIAVTGPPGTGKTTLIQTVIANLWTEAALQPGEADPPVIVVASTNNQAVTNVIKSFGEFTGDSNLGSRWLPEVKSFGLYCVSRGEPIQTRTSIPILTTHPFPPNSKRPIPRGCRELVPGALQ